MANTQDSVTAWDGERLTLSQLDLPAAVIDRGGALRGLSPRGRRLLERFGADPESAEVPADLVRVLDEASDGEAVVWNPGTPSDDASLGCTRHLLGGQFFLLVMRELTHKNQDLSKRLHKQRLEITGRLVASIVHELRAPLASIVFSGEVLTGRMNDLRASEVSAIVGDIVDSSRRLRHIVDGLLSFSRFEAPDDTVSRLDDVLDRVSSLVRPVLRDRGHTLRTYVAPGVRLVRGRGLMVEQILVNLVLNAAEAAEEPVEVIVTAHCDDEQPGRARIEVSDDGPGIPPDLRARVFQPFFTTKRSGTGLGLTSARESAREQGGDLVLLSDEDTGATFLLELDLAEPETTVAKATSNGPSRVEKEIDK